MHIYTNSEEETIELAKKIGGILKNGFRNNEIYYYTIYLIGEFGAGKTIFVKGLAQGLNVENYEYVCSPSFILVHRYEGEIPLYHIDLYRLKSQVEISDILSSEINTTKAVIAIEWADKISWLINRNRVADFHLESEKLNVKNFELLNKITSYQQLQIKIEHVNETTRKISILPFKVIPVAL